MAGVFPRPASCSRAQCSHRAALLPIVPSRCGVFVVSAWSSFSPVRARFSSDPASLAAYGRWLLAVYRCVAIPLFLRGGVSARGGGAVSTGGVGGVARGADAGGARGDYTGGEPGSEACPPPVGEAGAPWWVGPVAGFSFRVRGAGLWLRLSGDRPWSPGAVHLVTTGVRPLARRMGGAKRYPSIGACAGEGFRRAQPMLQD